MKNIFVEDIKKIESEITELIQAEQALKESAANHQKTLAGVQKEIKAVDELERSKIDAAKSSAGNKISGKEKSIALLHSLVASLPEDLRKNLTPQSVSMPSRIDLEHIAFLYDNITSSAISATFKKLFRTGGYYKREEMAQDFLTLCAEAELYLNREIKELREFVVKEEAEISRVAENVRREKEAQYEGLVKKFSKEESEENQNFLKSKKNFLDSDLVSGFSARIRNFLSLGDAHVSNWDEYDPTKTRTYDLAIGSTQIPIKTNFRSYENLIIERVPELANDHISVPFVVNISDPLRLLFKYSVETKRAASEQIQLIIMRMLRSAPADTYDVYLVDPADRGNNANYLVSSSEKNEKISFFTRNSKDEIRSLFKHLEQEIDRISLEIGSYNSVYEYTRKTKKHIKEKIVVLFGFPKGIPDEDLASFSMIMQNAKRCGIHIIVATEEKKLYEIRENSRLDDIDWTFTYEDLWTIIDLIDIPYTVALEAKNPNMNDISEGDMRVGKITFYSLSEIIKNRVFIIVDFFRDDTVSAESYSYEEIYNDEDKTAYNDFILNDLKLGDYVLAKIEKQLGSFNAVIQKKVQPDNIYSYEPESVQKCHKQFVDLYRRMYEQGMFIDNSFSHLFDMNDPSPYKDSTNGLHLPVMVSTEKNGGLCNFEIGTDERPHAMITGAAGSGKSTFLHAIISSIVMNYHPDDVELWLVDYGVVEFNFYYNNTPPHARLISLEKSPEFTYSFLSYVQSFFEKRSSIMRKEGIEKIQEYRAKHGKLSMPRIVLVIDEFHNMAQHIQKSQVFRDMLENIVSEYRKFGLTCIFSDQKMSNLLGLSEKSKEQLRSRIALSSSLYEMQTTLGLSNGNYTSEIIQKMERSKTGDIWYADSQSYKPTQYRGILIKKEERVGVVNKAIREHSTVEHHKETVKIHSLKREMLPLSDLSPISCTPKSIPLYLGTPSTMDKYFRIDVEKRYNHNMLIAGLNLNMKKDIVANIFKNLSVQGNSEIIVFADTYDPLYEKLENCGILSSEEYGAKVYSDLSRICVKIDSLANEVKDRKICDKNTFIFWFGFTDLFAEFAASPKKTENIIKAIEEERERLFITEEAIKDFEQSEVLIAEAKAEGRTVREMVEQMCADESNGESDSREVSNETIYNANPDVLELLAKSSRFGIFNVMVIDSPKEFTPQMRIPFENFGHKILLNMSVGDFSNLGVPPYEISVDEKSAIYSNGVERKKFRPYIIDLADDTDIMEEGEIDLQ